jgi:hypothetical protein
MARQVHDGPACRRASLSSQRTGGNPSIPTRADPPALPAEHDRNTEIVDIPDGSVPSCGEQGGGRAPIRHPPCMRSACCDLNGSRRAHDTIALGEVHVTRAFNAPPLTHVYRGLRRWAALQRRVAVSRYGVPLPTLRSGRDSTAASRKPAAGMSRIGSSPSRRMSGSARRVSAGWCSTNWSNAERGSGRLSSRGCV